MKVLSLFDGMACGMLAFGAAGIQVDRYVAFEIDPYAVKTSSHNFPMIGHRGDVFKADFTEFSGFDYLVGGSPCTYWSIAQKNNRETEASGMGWELFCQYVRALKEAQPMYFIYENNKSMSKAIRESITETFGFEPICINSALVSAQNRQRLYWVGKRNLDGTYSKVRVDQPEDRGILLRDVLDGMCWLDKSYTIDSNYHKTLGQQGFERQSGRRKMAAEPVACRCRGRVDKNGVGYAKYECREDDKANTLDTNTTNGAMVAEPVKELTEREMDYMVREIKGGRNHFDFGYIQDGTKDKGACLTANVSKGVPYNVCCVPVYVGEVPEHKGQYRNGKQASQQYRVYSVDGKSVACDQDSRKYIAQPVTSPIKVGLLPNNDGVAIDHQQNRIYSIDAKAVTQCGNGGGMGAKTGLYAIPVAFDGSIPVKAVSCADGKEYTVYFVKDGKITIKDKQYPIKLADGYYIIRKLTISECKRLQTVPEWYEFPVSNTQAYKMLGNGWTVEVIAHLIQATQADVLGDEQLSLFSMGVM